MSIQAEIHTAVEGFVIEAAFDAPAGSCTAVVGPNGAGKTTLIHALAGLVPLLKGRVVLNDQVVDDPSQGIQVPPERRPIALHSQHNLLFPHLKVLDNVAFGPRCAGLSVREARQQADKWLHRLRLAELAELRPEQLSGGQAQRVGLARAAACEPQVLLLDESLGALDAETRTDVRHLLADIDATRVLITHDPVEARVLAQQLLVMEQGQIVQTGTPEEVATDPRTPWTAGLLDINLLAGKAAGTEVALDSGLTLTTATPMAGLVLVTFPPAAVTLSTVQPHTSARNTWEAEVVRIQPEGDRVRVLLGWPAPCHVWVTPQAVGDLGLNAGARCWAALKATELTVREA